MSHAGVEAALRRRHNGAPLDAAEIRARFRDLSGCTFDDDGVLELFDDLSRAVCAPAHLRFAPERDKCELDCNARTVRLEGLLYAESGDSVGTIRRTLVFGAEVASHDQLIVNPAFRGVGIAALILEHALECYQRVGIRAVNLRAALTHGRYYWAKLNFEFLDQESSARVQNWFARVNAKLGLGLDCVAERQPRAWLHVGEGIEATCSLAELARAFPGELEERAQLLVKEVGVALDQPLPAGKAILLSGPDWSGRLRVTKANRTFLKVYLDARREKALERLRIDRVEPDNHPIQP